MQRNKQRRTQDRTEVSCCLKYLLFSFNVFFWLVGLGILAIGVWAWYEKQMFQNIGDLTEIFLDPGLLFIIVGCIIFIIGFAGCIGALRENTCLLMFFIACLVVILLTQVTVAVLIFVYKDFVNDRIRDTVNTYISRYRDDDDLQNIIDWTQDTWLYCCGVESPDDWNKNVYFNCSSPSRERCGVPFSCCKREDTDIVNLQCGYDVRTPENRDRQSQFIYTTGCLDAVAQWANNNMIPVAGTAVGIAVVEIIGICFAHQLRQDIFAQKAKWRRRR
ncbi:tetraspanin-5-like [Watersipora subatra]|uniref:tetraspanin-5-like n=1 Tax=Watersipora subatra TaxID=2589382 RepID=UPI00355C83E7